MYLCRVSLNDLIKQPLKVPHVAHLDKHIRLPLFKYLCKRCDLLIAQIGFQRVAKLPRLGVGGH